MAFLPTVKVLKAAQILNASTAAEWAEHDPILPENMMAYASDVGIIKIGDGQHKWSELAIFFNSTDEGGSGVTDAGTNAHITFVENIAARDALGDEEKKNLVIVIDASDDETVTHPEDKQVTYIWAPHANDDQGGWVKLHETDSVHIDLANYFNVEENTADDIQDGATKVIMTKEERERLADIDKDMVRYTDSIVIVGVNAEELKAMTEAASDEEEESEASDGEENA